MTALAAARPKTDHPPPGHLKKFKPTRNQSSSTQGFRGATAPAPTDSKIFCGAFF
jgi:hypothetical protein